MEPNNLNTTCICCLVRPPERNFVTTYLQNEKGENYIEMLKECYDIKLQMTSECGGICEVCISRLRDATDFRKQVLRCQTLIESVQINVKNSGSVVVKEEKHSDGECSLRDTASPGSPAKETCAIINNLVEIKIEDTKNPDAVINYHTDKSPDVEHNDTEGNKREYSCQYCSYVDSNEHSYLEHLRSHGKLYDCEHCANQFISKLHIKWHIVTQHRETISRRILRKINIYWCSYCDRGFYKKTLLLKHEGTHRGENETGEKPYKCQYCDFRSSQSYVVKRHEKIHTGLKPYKCKYCSFRSCHSNNIKSHEKIHTGEKRYKCQFCDFRSCHSNNIKCHEKIHTDEKPFKCQQCDYTSKWQHVVKRHEKLHSGDKPHKCQFCEFRSSTRRAVVGHERTHTGEKPYKCSYCDYRSGWQHAIKKHEKIHTGDKVHKCTYCEFTSKQRAEVRTHKLIHVGEKPFKCKFCDHTCAEKRSIELHERKHTNAPYTCQFCAFTSYYPSNMNMHAKMHTEKMFEVVTIKEELPSSS